MTSTQDTLGIKSIGINSGTEMEQNHELKQREILAAAARLFRIKGYERTSLDEIAAATNLKKPSLYHYFPNKQTMLGQIVGKSFEAIQERVKNVCEKELKPREKLSELVKQIIATIIDNLDFTVTWYMEGGSLDKENRQIYVQKRSELEHIVRDVINEGSRNGDFAPVNDKLAAFFTFGACNYILLWYRPGGKYSPEYIAEEYSRYVCGFLTASIPCSIPWEGNS